VGIWIGFVWFKMGFGGRLLLSTVIHLPNQGIYSIAATIKAAATPDKPAITGISNVTAALQGKRIKDRAT
jgi:hypothetical protein